MKRHKLVLRQSSNVKPRRFEMSVTSMASFYDRLEDTLQGVEASNIFNFDETNLADDPAKRKCVVRRGFKRLESKKDSSKSGFSVMFCGNAEGNYLPPMVVYKAKGNVYRNWMNNGPTGTRYGSTESGWFNSRMFEEWFFNIFLPVAR